MTRVGPPSWKPRRSSMGWCALLALGMLVVALALPAYQQCAVLHQLAVAGVKVKTDASGPAGIRDRLDSDPLAAFGAPVEVEAAGTRLGDALLESFLTGVELAGLERLSLLDTGISDEGLEGLCRAGRLEFLDLSLARVTNEGLQHVGCLSSLRHLALSGTQIDEEGLIRLRGLRNLQWLALGDTQITDAGLEYLTAFPRLKALFLTGTRR